MPLVAHGGREGTLEDADDEEVGLDLNILRSRSQRRALIGAIRAQTDPELLRAIDDVIRDFRAGFARHMG